MTNHAARQAGPVMTNHVTPHDTPHGALHYLVENEEDGRTLAFIRIDDKSVEASSESLALMMSTDSEPVQFEFGDKERLLMRYLEEYGRISVTEFASLANIARSEEHTSELQ